MRRKSSESMSFGGGGGGAVDGGFMKEFPETGESFGVALSGSGVAALRLIGMGGGARCGEVAWEVLGRGGDGVLGVDAGNDGGTAA
jgi:hypothetical protein